MTLVERTKQLATLVQNVEPANTSERLLKLHTLADLLFCEVMLRGQKAAFD